MSNEKTEKTQEKDRTVGLLQGLLKLGAHKLPNIGKEIHDIKTMIRMMPVFENVNNSLSTFLDNLVLITAIDENPLALIFVRKVQAEEGEKDGEILLQVVTEDASSIHISLTVEEQADGTMMGFGIHGDNRKLCESIAKAVQTVKAPNTSKLYREDNFAKKDANDAQEESSEEILND